MATAVAHDTSTTSDVLLPIEGDARWTGTVTYNIAEFAVDGEVEAFNALGPDIAMEEDFQEVWFGEFALAFAIYAEIADIDMVITDDLDADYIIGRSDDEAVLGSAGTPRGFIDFEIEQDFILFNAAVGEHVQDPELGAGHDRLLTIIHELGHSIGLMHPHDEVSGTTSTGLPDFEQVAPYQWHQTVMSYTEPPNVSPTGDPVEDSAFSRAVTPMALDIAALHSQYGANLTTRTGNSSYTLTDPGTAALVATGDAITIGQAYYGIWDAGTDDRDTIRYSGSTNVLINLNAAPLEDVPSTAMAALIAEAEARAGWQALHVDAQTEITDSVGAQGGFFSSLLDDQGNRITGGFSIANGVTIEAAEGGEGNDILFGNEAANFILGKGGDDLILGGGGRDVLRGGDGLDEIVGGEGGDVMSGGAGADLFVLDGEGGRDKVLDFALGEDVVDLSAWGVGAHSELTFVQHRADSVVVRAGSNAVVLQSTSEIAANSIGADSFIFDEITDLVLLGTEGRDRLVGGAGDDLLNGFGSRDIYIGGEGADEFVLGFDTSDKVLDFEDGIDILNVFEWNVAGFEELRIVQRTPDAVAIFGNGGVAIVQAAEGTLSVEDFDQFDFLFTPILG